MNDKIKTPRLNNLETYVLQHVKFFTYMVLLFTDLNKAQIYKMPCRDSPHHEIEILMKFDYLNVFRPNEHTEVYYIRKPNIESFPFKIEDKKFIHVGKKIFSFETDDENVKYSSEHGFNDVKFPFAHGKENIYFMLYQKYFSLQEYETSTVKNEYQYFHKKNEEVTKDPEGIDIVYGEDFLNCKVIHSKQ